MGMLDFAMRRKTRARLLRGERVHWVETSRRRRYITAVLLSTPPWVAQEDLRRIKDRARAMSAMEGVEYHVAHITLLNNDRVCGLTVPWNLVIKRAGANLAEGNYFCPEQLEMFP